MPWCFPLTPIEPRREHFDAVSKAEQVLDALRQENQREALRDMFAAAALTGLLDGSGDVGEDWEYRVIACRDAYNWADAMLEAREQKRPEPTNAK